MRAHRHKRQSALALRSLVAAAFAVTLSTTGANAQGAATGAAEHLTWGPAPAVFRKGARMAVVSGNPMASGEFVLRLDMPAGYRIAPHYHPTDEHLRVLRGTFLVGMGDHMNLRKTKRLTQGDTITAPATMHHYAAARGHTMIEVSGTGPFQLTYVNPKDLPKP